MTKFAPNYSALGLFCTIFAEKMLINISTSYSCSDFAPMSVCFKDFSLTQIEIPAQTQQNPCSAVHHGLIHHCLPNEGKNKCEHRVFMYRIVLTRMTFSWLQ